MIDRIDQWICRYARLRSPRGPVFEDNRRVAILTSFVALTAISLGIGLYVGANNLATALGSAGVPIPRFAFFGVGFGLVIAAAYAAGKVINRFFELIVFGFGNAVIAYFNLPRILEPMLEVDYPFAVLSLLLLGVTYRYFAISVRLDRETSQEEERPREPRATFVEGDISMTILRIFAVVSSAYGALYLDQIFRPRLIRRVLPDFVWEGLVLVVVVAAALHATAAITKLRPTYAAAVVGRSETADPFNESATE